MVPSPFGSTQGRLCGNLSRAIVTPALPCRASHTAPSGLECDFISISKRSGWRRSDGVAVEVEGYGTVLIGAVDADSGGLEALENGGFGEAEGIAVSHGDDSEGGPDRVQDFW